MKLGKLPAKHDARTPYLSEFLVRHKLPAPQPFNWLTGLPADLGMMGNDVAGDCTLAGVGHFVQVQSSVTGKPVVPTTEQVIDAYKMITERVNGQAYDPNDPSTDTGLALLDVLKVWRTEGLFGNKLGAFVKIRHNDPAEIQIGGRLFGGMYTGAMLPISAQSELAAGRRWAATTDEPGGWGGHCMYLGAGNPNLYVTWGKSQDATDEWIDKYADEVYVGIDELWVSGDVPAPSGFDIAKLRQFLAEI